MCFMPISFKQFEKDWGFTAVDCEIIRGDESICVVTGYFDSEDSDGKHYRFKYGTDIQTGDVIISENGNDVIRRIRVEKYNGSPDSITAFI